MLSIKEQRKAAFKYIDWILSHWRDVQQAVLAARVDRNTSVDENIGGGRSSVISDPTARDALVNVVPVESVSLRSGEVVTQPESWLKIIAIAFKQCDQRQQNIFKARFIDGLNITAISVRHGVPRTTCFDIIRRIKRLVFELALQHNLIFIV